MGLIKATSGAINSVLADQWIDYFYCDALDENTLVVKGQRRITNYSSNKRGTENYITSGSVIAVADGQCMIIVEQGKIIDVCDEPGEYIFDSERSKGIFTEEADEAVNLFIEKVKQRFIQGGQANLDQRIYYFNTKEIQGNKFGTPAPIPFRVIDNNVGLDMDVSLSCFGTFSYKITNPLLFYQNVTGNINEPFLRNRVDDQVEAEVISALQPAFAKLSVNGVRYSALPMHTEEICSALNDVLSEKWSNLRGIEVVSFAIKGLRIKEEDERMIKELQRNASFKDPTMAAAHLVGSQADAMKAAASNTSAGAAAAFLGVNMASGTSRMNASELFRMGEIKQGEATMTQNTPDSWTCSCGAVNTTNFCPSCGNKKSDVCRAAFCPNCGYNLGDGKLSRFCPNCGTQLE